MADFEEVMQDAGKDIKSFFKKNPFILLCIGVGAVALFLWWVRQKNGGDTTTYYDGEQAIGYGGYGYPSVGGSEYYDSANSDYWETVLDNLEDKFGALSDKHMEDIDNLKDKHDTDIGNLNDSWQERYDALLDKIEDGSYNDGYYEGTYTPITTVTTPSQSMNEQSIIDQMKANSNYWHYANDADKDYLHDQNVMLGESIGAQYDSTTGTWWKNGTPLYTAGTNLETPVTSMGYKDVPNSLVDYDSNTDYQAKINEAIRTNQGAAVINTLNAQRDAKLNDMGKTNAQVGYDKNTDYQALINQAKAQGASQSVIDNLTAQREAKIKGENLNVK